MAKGSTDERRTRRVGESIRGVLSRLLIRQIGDPRLALATITDVRMSPDLKSARVYYVPSAGGGGGDVGAGLIKATPFFRRELGKSLALRYTPTLTFHLDDSFDKGERVDRILHETHEDAEAATRGVSVEQALAKRMAESARILLAVHANPDGDAIGSLLGMFGILRLLGKRPVPLCPDGIPRTLRFLPFSDEVVGSLDPEASFDLTILMDTADENLLPDGFPPAERRGVLAVIDHHSAHGDLGDVVIRRDVSAVGELLHDLAIELLWPLDEKIAQCLYTSVVADTGSFRYSSTTPATHRAAADLIARGADPWAAATGLFESFTLSRQRLLGRLASTLEVSADGRYAQLVCTPDMLAETGTVKADLDSMINLGRSIAGVEISALFRVEPEGHIKVSFRSKGRVDVALLSSRFGGGGHRNAAGATLRGVSLEEAKASIWKSAAELLASPDPSLAAKPA
jgi:bifunctional oligoribonuclease and PAP phosphatase NrnA